MSIGALIAIISACTGPIITALVYMYKQREGTQKEIINLTKTFIEASAANRQAFIEHSSSNKQVLENTTNALNELRTCIKELPDQIMLHTAARRNGD